MTEIGDWPVQLAGISECIVTTEQPNGQWNLSALGLIGGEPATATTWGNTRTKRNFERTGIGFIQFTQSTTDFVAAALDVLEFDEPILPASDAWVKVTVQETERGTKNGTTWTSWQLDPVQGKVVRQTVPVLNRGTAAVIEATVAASRLDVNAYDVTTLLGNLQRQQSIVERCGREEDKEAFERLTALTGWDRRNE